MRTLLMVSAAALLAGSMAAYGADQQASEAATGGATISAPAFAPGARAQVPTGPAPAVQYQAPVDEQDPNLSR